MKLQLQQALATVLNIQVMPLPDLGNDADHMLPKYEDHFVSLDHPLISLGKVKNTTLHDAVWKAMQSFDMQADCHYAVFPIGSNREDYYMAIERELLRQEATEEFQSKKMWELLGSDPRELITCIMDQMRNCVTSLTDPVAFQTALLRAGCLIIASLQWTSDWIARCKIRNAALVRNMMPPPTPVILKGKDEVPPHNDIDSETKDSFHNPNL